MTQGVFKSILHDARNERALPLEKQTEDELRRGIAETQMKMQDGVATNVDRQRYDAILSEILKRRKDRQNG